MQTGALAPYEHSLKTAGPLALQAEDGRTIELDVTRWLAAADDVDRTVLARCTGPTLDVGCGPGRFVAALLEQGVSALGVDIAETAVRLARRRGLPTVHRSVFEPVPGGGRWEAVVLMDGNIGIGGDPPRLLRRVRELLAPGGRLLIESDPDDDAADRLSVRFIRDGYPIGPAFDWARVGINPLRRIASHAGYSVVETWSAGGRSFASLSC
jgi:SAM-dependent methyltransferase